jgi:hypothetical protein
MAQWPTDRPRDTARQAGQSFAPYVNDPSTYTDSLDVSVGDICVCVFPFMGIVFVTGLMFMQDNISLIT